jgi:type I restriction enzyme S subunit
MRGTNQRQRYPDYKDSGVEWLGEIPVHWEIKQLKYAVKINQESIPETTDLDYVINYIDIGNVDSNGRILNTQEMPFSNAPSRARRKVGKGDTIISTVRTYLKAIAFIGNPLENWIVSTGFAVLSPNSEIRPKYLWRLVQSDQFVSAVVANSEGVSYPAIPPTQLASLPIWLPSPSEQDAIAAYLDRETAKIDTLIGKKERLIELLQEQRAALISQAVTKGLKPGVPLKDSGVEWLGEIPAHWEVKRLKFLAEVRTGTAKGREFGDRETIELPYLRVANVQDGYLDLSDIATITIGADEIERYLLKPGDVLMNEGGDFDKLGRGYVWHGEIPKCVHQNHVFAVRPRPNINPYWLNTITLTSYAKFYFILKSKQSTNLASISSSNLKELPVLFPPKREQDAILDFIGQETARIDALVAKTQETLERLREYRTALISAAVTGKIDVRGVG